MDQLYVAHSLFKHLLSLAANAGYTHEEVFTYVGLSEEQMEQGENGSLPLVHVALLYDFLEQKTGNAEIGLHAGQRLSLAALGIVGQLVQVSRTIQEALEKAREYFNAISNALHMEVNEQEGVFSVSFVPHKLFQEHFPNATRHMVHASMAFAYRELYFLLGSDYLPLEVKTVFESDVQAVFEKAFNRTVVFQASENALVFPKKILSEKVMYADYELLLILEKVACERLTHQSQKEPSLSVQIQTIIYSLLNPALPQFHEVAAQLNLSTRSLQRKLKEENTSYSQITESVKKDLAMTYLRKNLSIKEVSYLMGYTEPSSFVTAFKRWFGRTPMVAKSLL